MIEDILEEITEDDIGLLEEIKNYPLTPLSCSGTKRFKMANTINKMLLVYEDYKELRKQRERIKSYIVNELIEINKHQYAGGSRRLKKILRMIQEFDDTTYRGY